MTLRSMLFSGAAIAAFASPAFALTADEVWQNQTGYLSALGLVATSTPLRDGSTLVMSDVRYIWALPMDLGSVKITSPDVTFVENADGTVAISYPEKSRLNLRADISADGETASFEASIALRLIDNTTTARGTPAAVTYVSKTGLMDLVLDDISIEGSNVAPDDLAAFDLAFTVTDTSTETTIADDGQAYAIAILSTTGRILYESTSPDGFGAISTTAGESAATSNTVTFKVPRTPVDWLNLSPALREGLALRLTSEAAGTRQQTVAKRDNTIETDLTQMLDRSTTSFSLSSAGMTLGGDVQDLTVLLSPSKEIPVPMPLSFSVEDMLLGFTIPLLADPAPQAVSFDLALHGVSLPEDLWSMFDPGAVLPRDPATLAFGIDAVVISRIDLPDIMAWEAMADRIESGESPVDLVSLNVTGVEAAAIGVKLTGEAAFTFDNADRTTFPGFPRPEGEASAQITGLYAALGKLSQIGLLPTEAGLGARAAIGMFAKATGDDQLASTLAIGPDGTITVNGLPFPIP